MDSTSECNTSAAIVAVNQTAKRKFFQWAVKWFYANMAEDNLEKPDAPVLVSLLQSIGFQLREFEKVEESDRTKESKPAENTVRLFVECGSSGMRACLELNDVKCKCPNPETAKEASFWSVSGVGGSGSSSTATIKSANRIEESGSNLLPPLPKETNKILHDVTYHLLNIIADKSPDMNQNSKNHSNLNLSAFLNATMNKDSGDNTAAENLKKLSSNIVRSYTQPEIVLPHAGARKFKWNVVPLDKTDSDFERNGSKWNEDLESEIIDNDQPRPSPPKIASSPVFMNQFCNSLSQISLHSEEEAGNVAEHVIQARKNLDKALEILMAKKSPNSRNSPNLEEGTFLKPAPGGLNLTGGGTSRLSTSSTCSNGSLRSPSGGIRSRQSSSFSLPPRESSQAKKTTSQTTVSKPPTSNITRRSVGPALSTSMVGSSCSGGTIKRQISNVDQNNASKIPGRRKSFGVLASQPLRLAATSARLTASSVKRKSPDPKGTTLNQSSTQKVGSSINQPPPNPKYGFVRKKSSLV